MRASVINRDREKFEPLLMAAKVYVLGTTRRILRMYGDDVVDDVIAKALAKAWEKRAQFKGRSSFNSWFTRIVINEAFMFLRRAKDPDGAERLDRSGGSDRSR